MHVRLFRGRRRHDDDVQRLGLLREYPLGRPLWQRVLLVAGLCYLWVWLVLCRASL